MRRLETQGRSCTVDLINGSSTWIKGNDIHDRASELQSIMHVQSIDDWNSSIHGDSLEKTATGNGWIFNFGGVSEGDHLKSKTSMCSVFFKVASISIGSVTIEFVSKNDAIESLS